MESGPFWSSVFGKRPQNSAAIRYSHSWCSRSRSGLWSVLAVSEEAYLLEGLLIKASSCFLVLLSRVLLLGLDICTPVSGDMVPQLDFGVHVLHFECCNTRSSAFYCNSGSVAGTLGVDNLRNAVVQSSGVVLSITWKTVAWASYLALLGPVPCMVYHLR